jgi:hypothetical protein
MTPTAASNNDNYSILSSYDELAAEFVAAETKRIRMRKEEGEEESSSSSSESFLLLVLSPTD